MLGIFLDQETTGLDPQKHHVAEIAFRVVDLSNGKELAAYESFIALSDAAWEGRDLNSMKVNGIERSTLDTVGRSVEEVGQETQKLLKEAGIRRGSSAFICQNPSFDRPFFAQLVSPYQQEKLFWPYHWLDLASMYWAIEIQKCRSMQGPIPDELRLSKDAIAASLKLPPESRPHKAMHGVDHLLLCYKHLVGFPQ